MEVNLSLIPKSILNELKSVGECALSQQIHAFLVGGAVRDLILEKEAFDYDVVLVGDAIAFAETWAKKRGLTLVTHKQFGTATVTYPDGWQLDLVMARKEYYPRPGAFPKVKPSNMYDDLYRRDFTINAIATSLIPDSWGELVDYFHGMNDLDAKLLKVLHPLSFIDDPTRILRLIRYKVRLGFSIEPATLGLMNEALQQDVFKTISSNRLQNEINIIRNEPQSDTMLSQCKAHGLVI